PPAALVARSTKAGVQLTWRRPVTYTGGQRMNDLGGFDIERSPADGGTEEFGRIGRMELNDQQRFRQERTREWTETTAGAGARSRYGVIAFTLDDYHSEPAGPVEVTFGRPEADRTGSGQ